MDFWGSFPPLFFVNLDGDAGLECLEAAGMMLDLSVSLAGMVLCGTVLFAIVSIVLLL